MYCWGSRDRLAPMRMVWLEHNYNDHRFESRQMQRKGRSLQAMLRCDWKPRSRVESSREDRRDYPGLTGKWPIYGRWPKRPVKKTKRPIFGRH